jgi:deferrochelatase/peroxidase EfeB
MPTGNPSPVFPALPQFPLGRANRTDTQRASEDVFLDSIQGNILKGHGREHMRLVFFQFTGTRELSFKFLRDAVARDQNGQRRWVLSALDQLTQRDLFHDVWQRLELVKRGREKLTPVKLEKLRRDERIVNTQLFCSLMLTKAGLNDLKLALPKDPSFAAGLRSKLNGVTVAGEQTEEPYCREGTARDFHGVFLLAADEVTAVNGAVDALRDWSRGYGVEFLPDIVEEGFAWRDNSDPYGNGYCPPREPFGFADGISQPHIFASERRNQPLRTDRAPAWTWTDLTAEDVFLAEAAHAGGSLAVLLKIEQKVATFRRYEDQVIDLLNKTAKLPLETAKYVAPALLMGRTRQGYPLSEVIGRLPKDESGLRKLFPDEPKRPDPTKPHEPPPYLPPWLNEFDFEAKTPSGTPQVSGCPFHMHMRKMNPRTSDSKHATKEAIIRAQVIRRGATYDKGQALIKKETGLSAEWPDSGAGLLFLAYMSDIALQFEFLHTDWAYDCDFPQKGVSAPDPLLTHPEKRVPDRVLKFGDLTLPAMPDVLRRLGGVYLYVPSIPWLEQGHS